MNHLSPISRRIALRLAVAAAAVLTTMGAHAGFDGTYRVQAPAGTVTVRLETAGPVLQGTLSLPGAGDIGLAGVVDGAKANGMAMADAGMGAFEARVDGDTLSLVLSSDGESVPVTLTRDGVAVARPVARVSSPALPVPKAGTGSGDPRVMGQWYRQIGSSSYGGSYASERFLTLASDGSYRITTGRSVASGSNAYGDWSQGANNGGEIVESGRWKTADGQMYFDGGSGWVQFHYGMTDDGSALRVGRVIWSRN